MNLATHIMARFNPDEPRDSDGKWGSGGTTLSKKGLLVDKAKQKAGAANAVYIGRTQQQAAEHTEQIIAKAVGGESFKDSEPVDVVTKGDDGKMHGIEVKTLINKTSPTRTASGRAESIFMTHGAVPRKQNWAKANKASLHTVVVDRRNGGLKVYHANGVGSFSFGRDNSPLQPVPGGFSGLRKVMGLRRDN